MKFTDFTAEQLIGMNVLIERRNGQFLGKIDSSTKTRLKVDNMVFNIKSGHIVGQGDYPTIFAKLITAEQAGSARLKTIALKQIEKIRDFARKNINLFSDKDCGKINDLFVYLNENIKNGNEKSNEQ